jgi:peptide alpha-N-acetyltransferase
MIDTIGAELAEPYSIFTYNYFISQFPKLTIMAYHCDRIIGCIIGKCENKKAYIAMLVVDR